MSVCVTVASIETGLMQRLEVRTREFQDFVVAVGESPGQDTDDEARELEGQRWALGAEIDAHLSENRARNDLSQPDAVALGCVQVDLEFTGIHDQHRLRFLALAEHNLRRTHVLPLEEAHDVLDVSSIETELRQRV